MNAESIETRLDNLETRIMALHEMQAQTYAWLSAHLAGRSGDKEYQQQAVNDYFRRLDELAHTLPVLLPVPSPDAGHIPPKSPGGLN